jgi:hypothetical protein
LRELGFRGCRIEVVHEPDKRKRCPAEQQQVRMDRRQRESLRHSHREAQQRADEEVYDRNLEETQPHRFSPCEPTKNCGVPVATARPSSRAQPRREVALI